MKATADEAAEFRAECLRWQREFGLLHWTLAFKVEEAKPDCHDEAEVDFDCDTRHATLTYYTGIKDALHPKDTAKHEMLHLLFADVIHAAVNGPRGEAGENDATVAREEHKVIEILIKVIR